MKSLNFKVIPNDNVLIIPYGVKGIVTKVSVENNVVWSEVRYLNKDGTMVSEWFLESEIEEIKMELINK
jgi:hypothetical protein